MDSNHIQEKLTFSLSVEHNNKFVARLRQDKSYITEKLSHRFHSIHNGLHGKKLYLAIFFIFAFFDIIAVSGITYGWSLIEIVFETSGYYSALCKDKDTLVSSNRTVIVTKSTFLIQVDGFNRNIPSSANTSSSSAFIGNVSSSAPQLCSAQSERLNLVFTIALVFLCVSQFFIGYFADKYGPKATQCIGR